MFFAPIEGHAIRLRSSRFFDPRRKCERTALNLSKQGHLFTVPLFVHLRLSTSAKPFHEPAGEDGDYDGYCAVNHCVDISRYVGGHVGDDGMLSCEFVKKFGDMVTEGYVKCGRKCCIDSNLNSWRCIPEDDISYTRFISRTSHRETSTVQLLCFLDKGTECTASTIHSFAWKSLSIRNISKPPQVCFAMSDGFIVLTHSSFY
jgi:hypothetical protein